MENTNRDIAQNATPKNDWQDAETNETGMKNDEFHIAEPTYDSSENQEETSIYAIGLHDDPDDEDEDDEDEDEDEDEDAEEEEEAGDWGHVDPAESNSPFPDSNAPGFPGSAV